ncbi:putative Transmembrane 9 superfamily member 3, partial [Cardiosporidium cionae]
MLVFIISLMISCHLLCVAGDNRAREYSYGVPVILLVDKYGPHGQTTHWPSFETYSRCFGYSLEDVFDKPELKNSIAISNTMEVKNVQFRYMMPVENETLCTMEIGKDRMIQMKNIIDTLSWLQLKIDRFPFWLSLGANSNASNASEYSLYSHYHFVFTTNPPFLLGVTVESTHPVNLEEGMSLPVTYSVAWNQTDQPMIQQQWLKKYPNAVILNEEIHWYGIIIGLPILLLSVVVAFNVSFKMFAKRSSASIFPFSPEIQELGNLTDIEENGWKLLHGDVFRRPSHFLFLSILVGSGSHVFVVTLLTIGLTYFYCDMDLGPIVRYYITATQIVGGFVGGYVFKAYGGKRICLLKSFAAFNDQSLSFNTVEFFLYGGLVYIFLNIPLHILGTLLGRRYAVSKFSSITISKIRRPIPARSKFF